MNDDWEVLEPKTAAGRDQVNPLWDENGKYDLENAFGKPAPTPDELTDQILGLTGYKEVTPVEEYPKPAPKPENAEYEQWNGEGDLDSEFHSKDVQWVPTKHLVPLQEYNRTPGGQEGISALLPKYEALRQHIIDHGFKNPVWVDYHQDTGHAHVSEGNHRLTIAQELGIPALPVKVYRSRRNSNGLSQRLKNPEDVKEAFNGWIPQTMKASDIGLPTTTPWSPGTPKTAALTRTQMLQEQERFHNEFGPDNAQTAHQFPDGWSIKTVQTPHQESYEGELMNNCIGGAATLRNQIPERMWHEKSQLGATMMSLRDPQNIPHASFVDPQVWNQERYSDDPSQHITSYWGLDVEGRNGSNAAKYAPYIHDWWVAQGGKPAHPADWDSHYGVPLTQAGSPEHQAEEADTYFEHKMKGFWHPKVVDKTVADMPHLKRAVKPLQKAEARLHAGEDINTVAEDVRKRLLNNYKPEQVDHMIDDLHRVHKDIKKYAPYDEEQMKAPSRIEFPEFYWMHGAYGPEVMNEVQKAQESYKALHWNHPQMWAGQLRDSLDALDMDSHDVDKIANHWYDAHKQAYGQRTGYNEDHPMQKRKEEEAWEFAQEQAKMVKDMGSPISLETLQDIIYRQALERRSSVEGMGDASVLDNTGQMSSPNMDIDSPKSIKEIQKELTRKGVSPEVINRLLLKHAAEQAYATI